jgi:hypothetical protein
LAKKNIFYLFKNKVAYNICGYINWKEKKNYPCSFGAVVGSGIGIRDPGWIKIRIRDLGSGINIPDPQHCPF